jgi:uncharacterized phage protein (TIGR02220 family)
MMRKAFNFYRSYYDVALLLPELERAEFIMCICHAQFTGELIEPKLPIAKLAYIGQLHSIKKQLEGYNYGLKTPKKTEPLEEPLEGAYESPLKEPLPQVQVQEKEKEEYTIDFEALLQYLNDTFGRKFKVVNADVRKKYKSLFKKGYTKHDVFKSIQTCKNNSFHKDTNYQYCTPEYFSRSEIIDKYGSVSTEKTHLRPTHPIIID